MNNKKGNATNIAVCNDLEHGFTMNTIPQNKPQNKPQFQYKCSFCWRELPSGGTRFNGFGVCPLHLKLAEKVVDALRGHAANYSNRFGGVK